MFEPARKVRKFVKVCLWGEPKRGKTEFALSFPKVCVIDTEKGTLLFSDRYNFAVKEIVRWKDLGAALDWLKANPGKFETLVIDSATPIYKDLVDQVTEAAKNRSGREVLAHADWGVIKRRFNAFLTMLLELPMNVVLTIRSKDEYENTKDHQGADISRKTGLQTEDIDKSARYLFDFLLHCDAVIDKKTKVASRYTVTIDGSRRPELKRGEVFDVTGKKGFDVVFSKVARILSDGAPMAQTVAARDLDDPAEPRPRSAAISTDQRADPADHPKDAAVPMTGAEKLHEIDKFFGTRQPGNPCNPEDLKVLYTRVGQVRWPDGSKMTKDQIKRMVKALYGVESGKDLHQHEVDFLYDTFGEILSGKAVLAEEEGEIVVSRVEPAQV